MPSRTCHLPNGQTFTVRPVFGGVSFAYNDPHLSQFALPAGWTVFISTTRRQTHGDTFQERFTRPTLNNDCFYISSIVNPTDLGERSVNSPTREIAIMVWVTLLWYFQEPEPDSHMDTETSAKTPWPSKPKGDWGIYLQQEGVFKGRNMLQKLERMGLVATEDSSVGNEAIETRDPNSWARMFVSRRSFWQIEPRLFLSAPSVKTSSVSDSPSRGNDAHMPEGAGPAVGEGTFSTATGGPFISSGHLPTYYPPPPTQYIFSNGTRHLIRPKAPHQGEVFYVRYIPSVQEYLSFRVPFIPSSKFQRSLFAPFQPQYPASSVEEQFQNMPSDQDVLFRWMNHQRMDDAWFDVGNSSQKEEFLRASLQSRHSFPIIGCWNGKPFGLFQIFWVKEDNLGRLLDGVNNYDRGVRVIFEDDNYSNPHRVAIWLSSLVHYCWLADVRTEAVLSDPEVNNAE